MLSNEDKGNACYASLTRTVEGEKDTPPDIECLIGGVWIKHCDGCPYNLSGDKERACHAFLTRPKESNPHDIECLVDDIRDPKCEATKDAFVTLILRCYHD